MQPHFGKEKDRAITYTKIGEIENFCLDKPIKGERGNLESKYKFGLHRSPTQHFLQNHQSFVFDKNMTRLSSGILLSIKPYIGGENEKNCHF